jgi:hypothetical protein
MQYEGFLSLGPGQSHEIVLLTKQGRFLGFSCSEGSAGGIDPRLRSAIRPAGSAQ